MPSIKYKPGDRVKLVNVNGWTSEWRVCKNEIFIIDEFVNDYAYYAHSLNPLNLDIFEGRPTTLPRSFTFLTHTLNDYFELINNDSDLPGWF